jgi:general secretion pathway protein G
MNTSHLLPSEKQCDVRRATCEVQRHLAPRTSHLARLSRNGFTILELLLVLVILAVLAGIVGSRFVGQSQSAKIKAAQTQLQNFKLALGRYEIDLGRYPTSSEGLRVLVEKPSGQNVKAWQGPYLDGDAVPKDQWENAWNYRQPGQHNPQGYDLWSNGPDGAEGGSDDISNWTK